MDHVSYARSNREAAQRIAPLRTPPLIAPQTPQRSRSRSHGATEARRSEEGSRLLRSRAASRMLRFAPQNVAEWSSNLTCDASLHSRRRFDRRGMRRERSETSLSASFAGCADGGRGWRPGRSGRRPKCPTCAQQTEGPTRPPAIDRDETPPSDLRASVPPCDLGSPLAVSAAQARLMLMRAL